MNFDSFYERCMALPEPQRVGAKTFYSIVIETFGGDSPDFNNRSLIIRLFYGKRSTLSKSQFFMRRKQIQMLYAWLNEQGVVGEQTMAFVNTIDFKSIDVDHNLQRYYFADLDEVLNFIKWVGTLKGFNLEDDLLFIKSVAILAWHGVSLADMSDIKRSDLLESSLCVRVGERCIEIGQAYFAILLGLSNTVAYRGFPTHRKCTYIGGVYLFRSNVKSHLDASNMQSAIRRFNAEASSHGKELSVVALKQNSVFCEILNASGSSDEGMRCVALRDMIGCDSSFATHYSYLYRRWKETIIGNGES